MSYLGDCLQPLAIFLGSDNKPARVRVSGRGIYDLWLVPGSVAHINAHRGVSLIEHKNGEWIFNHCERLPVLDMWGNIVEDGVTGAVASYEDEKPELEYGRYNELIIHDAYGNGKEYRLPMIKKAIKELPDRWLCNIDYNNLGLSKGKFVIPDTELSEDLGLLSYQSSMFDFKFDAMGSLTIESNKLGKMQDNSLVIPDNWIDCDFSWVLTNASAWRSIAFPKKMFRLSFKVAGSEKLKSLVLPECLTNPCQHNANELAIMTCPTLEEVILPACRGPLSIQFKFCSNLRSIRSVDTPYVSRDVSLFVNNCPRLEEVVTPNYKYRDLSLTRASEIQVYRHMG